MALLPDANRVKIVRIPLDIVASGFLAHHRGGEPPAYANGRVLRQKGLPDDARVHYCRCDYTANPPVLIVAVESAAWEPVAVGQEPEWEPDLAALLPAASGPVAADEDDA